MQLGRDQEGTHCPIFLSLRVDHLPSEDAGVPKSKHTQVDISLISTDESHHQESRAGGRGRQWCGGGGVLLPCKASTGDQDRPGSKAVGA